MLEERPNSHRRVGSARSNASRSSSGRQVSYRVGVTRHVSGRVGSARPSDTRRPKLHTGRPSSAPPGRVSYVHVPRPTPPTTNSAFKTRDIGHLNLKVEGKSIRSVAYSTVGSQRPQAVNRGSVRVVASHSHAVPPKLRQIHGGQRIIPAHDVGSDSERSTLMGFGTTYTLPLNPNEPIVYGTSAISTNFLSGSTYIQDEQLGDTYTLRSGGSFTDKARVPPDGKAERVEQGYPLVIPFNNTFKGNDKQFSDRSQPDSLNYGDSAFNIRPQNINKGTPEENRATGTYVTRGRFDFKRDTDSGSNDGSECTVMSLGQKIQLMASSPEHKRPEENWDSEWKQLLKQNHELLLKLSSREDLRSPDAIEGNIEMNDSGVQTSTYAKEREAEKIKREEREREIKSSAYTREERETEINSSNYAREERETEINSSNYAKEEREIGEKSSIFAREERETEIKSSIYALDREMGDIQSPSINLFSDSNLGITLNIGDDDNSVNSPRGKEECILEDIIEESSSNKSSPTSPRLPNYFNMDENIEMDGQGSYSIMDRKDKEIDGQQRILSPTPAQNFDSLSPISPPSINYNLENTSPRHRSPILSPSKNYNLGNNPSHSSSEAKINVVSDGKRSDVASSDFACTADLPVYRPGSATCIVLKSSRIPNQHTRTQPSKDLLDAIKMIEEEENRTTEDKSQIEELLKYETIIQGPEDKLTAASPIREENIKASSSPVPLSGTFTLKSTSSGQSLNTELTSNTNTKTSAQIFDTLTSQAYSTTSEQSIMPGKTYTTSAQSIPAKTYTTPGQLETPVTSKYNTTSGLDTSIISKTFSTFDIPPHATLPVLQVLVEKVFLFTQDLGDRWKLGGEDNEQHEELLRQVVEAERVLEGICVGEGRKRDPNIPPEELHAKCREEIAKSNRENDARIQRNLDLIRKLMDDKRALTERCEEILRANRVLEKKHSDKIKVIETKHNQELQNLKERTLASEQEKREKWTRQKTRVIKETTYRGLETKLKDQSAKHRDEISQLKEQHWEEKRQAEEKHVIQLRAQEEELKKKYEEEREEACRKEQDRSQQRLDMEMRQSEQQALSRLESVRKQHEHDLRQLVEEHNRELNSLRSEAESISKSAVREKNRLEEQHENKISQLTKAHKEEIAEINRKEERLREEWKQQLRWEAEEAKQRAEKELKDRLKRQRDREIDRAIREVQREAEAREKETLTTCNAKIKNLRDKYETEFTELESSEQGARERYLEMRSVLAQKEEEIVYLRARLHTQDLELTELQHMFRPPDI